MVGPKSRVGWETPNKNIFFWPGVVSFFIFINQLKIVKQKKPWVGFHRRVYVYTGRVF